MEVVDLPFPVESEEQILAAYDAKLRHLKAQTHSFLALASLDHISSLPATVFPIAKLVPMCREVRRGVAVSNVLSDKLPSDSPGGVQQGFRRRCACARVPRLAGRDWRGHLRRGESGR